VKRIWIAGSAGSGKTTLANLLGKKLSIPVYHRDLITWDENDNVRSEEEQVLMCSKAIDEIEKVCRSLDIDPDFTRRDSLYYASRDEDVSKLEREFEYLKKHGFDVDWMTSEDIGRLYPFSKDAAIYFRNDGELNPYKFTTGLVKKAHSKGIRVFEHTHVQGKKAENDYTLLYMKNGSTIKARNVIVAAGYECQEFKQDKNVSFVSSYAAVTNPVEDFSDWHKRTLIWETARPYIYMRTTPDNRVIIGGLDENTTIAEKRDGMLVHKKNQLMQEFNKLFPNIKVQPEFYLSAFYGGTHDGMPLIGIYEDLPNWYFLMGYGDNGTVYSMVLSKIIAELITSGSSPHLDIYLQTRPRLK